MNALELKDFMKYHFLSAITYAPTGQYAAFIASAANEEENNYKQNIWLYDESNNEVKQLTALDKENCFIWEDETHLLFPAVRSANEKKRVEAKDIFTSYYRISIHGGEAQPAFTLPFAASNLKKVSDHLFLAFGEIDAAYPDFYCITEAERSEIIKTKSGQADYEIFDEYPFCSNGNGFINKKRTALFLYDSSAKICTRITEPFFNVQNVAVTDQKIYFSGESYQSKPDNTDLLYCYNISTSETNCLYGKKEYLIYAIEVVGTDLVIAATAKKKFGENENPYLYRFDFETSEFKCILDYEYSFDSSVGSDCRLGEGTDFRVYKEYIYATTTIRNASHLIKISLTGEVTTLISEEGSIDSFDISPAGNPLLIGMYYGKLQECYQFKDNQLQQISEFNSEILADKYVSAYEKVTIQSQGTDIDGWILKPINYSPEKSYPAVLDIHGGPKTVYGEVFYHEMQYWAGLGYFVFFCNPTGSDGRGNEFADIRGKYGTIDYQNIMDFTDTVLSTYPQIDNTRVAVTGGSYGGFMTNWIIGHTNRFCCAATQRSITNWVSFYGISDVGASFTLDQIGTDLFGDIEKLWQHSPLKYASEITTPTLFIHSDEDYRCPITEGIQLYTALVNQNIPTRFCYFKGENHELSRSGKPKHRARRLEEITNWIEHYCTAH